eukprot:EG_transcript_11600
MPPGGTSVPGRRAARCHGGAAAYLVAAVLCGLCWPVLPAPDHAVPDPPPPTKLAFLFLIERRILHETLWVAFFHAAPPAQYSVYVHPKANRTLSLGDFFTGKVLLPNQIAPTVWGWLVDGMNALLRAALADPGNAHFAFLSPTTVPVKPFPEVYAAIVGPNRSSYICVTPSWEWIQIAGPQYIVKHHQWLSLNRAHAWRIAHAGGPDVGYRFPIAKYGKRCEDEYAYFHALYGPVGPSGRPGRPNLNDGRRLAYPSNTEQGVCHTYVWWNREAGLVFNTIPLDGCQMLPKKVANPFTFTVVTLEFLQALRTSSFLFARKFAPDCAVVDARCPLAPVLTRLLHPSAPPESDLPAHCLAATGSALDSDSLLLRRD